MELLDSSDARIAPLAETLLLESLLPENARADALHVAIATVHRVDYLLTWNCRHIANADQFWTFANSRAAIRMYTCFLGYVRPFF